MKPTFLITPGDPLGIGWEITQAALSDESLSSLANWQVIGSSNANKKYTPLAAGKKSWDDLKEAVDLLRVGEAQGLVTGPVSKTHLKLAGFPFPGQTEFLAHAFQTKKTAMMLAAPTLRVVLVTIHIPLALVPQSLTTELILEKIELTHESLKENFGIKNPRLLLCGLNPHAGEEGLMGQEEKTLIIPALEKARKKSIAIEGPFPPDTIFHKAIEEKYDAVVCHYHDQGLIPLKTLSFYDGVNTTLGLPIIRTSPDHGPAFDKAGLGKSNPQSMKSAMKMAVLFYKNRMGSISSPYR